MSWDKSPIKKQLEIIKGLIEDFEKKVEDRSFMRAERIPARINEIKAIQAMFDGIIHILQSHKG